MLEPGNRSLLHYFAAASIDRMAEKRRDETWLSGQAANPAMRVVPVWRRLNLVRDQVGDDCRAVFLTLAELEEAYPGLAPRILLGRDKESGRVYFAVELPGDDAAVPGRFASLGEFKDLVKIGARTDRRHGAVLAYARAITYWNRGHQFCGVCGSPTRGAEAGHLRVCTGERCKREHFPRTDPAIIVLVTDGEKCLLGRSTRWPRRLYSTIAGFVEPGESLELAVAREVMEETGVLVDPGQAVYHSSQPWPFPASIMLGFTAYARQGEIQVDRSELEDARWFSREELRKATDDGTIYLPLKFSIAYRLIDDWRNSG